MTGSETLTSDVFQSGITKLEAAFRHQPLSEGSVNIYFERLKSIGDAGFQKAVETIIDTEDFFPSIAKIIKASEHNKRIPVWL